MWMPVLSISHLLEITHTIAVQFVNTMAQSATVMWIWYVFISGTQVSVVHICEATLKKRLVEFEHTESGSLTVCFDFGSANNLAFHQCL